MAPATGSADSLPENVSAASHPVIIHKVTKMRNKETTNKQFRELMAEITSFLGYEATTDLKTKDVSIQTPLAPFEGQKLSSKVALIPVLRAGLGMVDAMLNTLPQADVHHIGMYRNPATQLPVLYYNNLPAVADCDVAIVLEPLIATSETISAVLDILKQWGVKAIKVLTVLASKPGLEKLHQKHPDVQIHCAVVDEALNENEAVVPGFGDVGDRLFRGDSDAVDISSSKPALNGSPAKKAKTKK